MNLVERLLKRLGVLSHFSDDDVINAEIEDKVREHDTVIARLDKAFTRRSATNAHLRETLKIAKHRTNEFATLEQQFRRND